jgi:hypothetical protein
MKNVSQHSSEQPKTKSSFSLDCFLAHFVQWRVKATRKIKIKKKTKKQVVSEYLRTFSMGEVFFYTP